MNSILAVAAVTAMSAYCSHNTVYSAADPAAPTFPNTVVAMERSGPSPVRSPWHS